MNRPAAEPPIGHPGYRPTPPWKNAARSLVRHAVYRLLRFRSKPLPLPSHPGTTIVAIAPHPDDEALGCAGLIAQVLAAGVAVRIVYITDGSASHREHPHLTPAETARRRAAEAHAAMALLGVAPEALVFLDAPDGTLAHLTEAEANELTHRIAAALEASSEIAAVVVPCRKDGSSEHEAVFSFVRRALSAMPEPPKVLEYPVWAWWSPLRLLRPLWESRRVWHVTFPSRLEAKCRALACYVSQVAPTAPWTEPLLSREFVASFSTATEFFFEI